MAKNLSFKFLDEKLNQQLLELLKKSKVKHHIGKDGAIHYARADEAAVEDDLICTMRDKVFSRWQVLTCPRDWIMTYEEYMRARRIPFHKELSNGEVWFLLPGQYRPHRWKLNDPVNAERQAI